MQATVKRHGARNPMRKMALFAGLCVLTISGSCLVGVPLLPEAAGAIVVHASSPQQGSVHVAVRDAATGALIPSRIRVEGLGLSRTPDVRAPRRDSVLIDTVVAAGGEVTLPLPPGEYRILCTRGPEWTIASRDLRVVADRRSTLEIRLTHVAQPGDWVASDFHVHSDESPDSAVSAEQRVASLLAEGVRFAVATEHNVATTYPEDALEQPTGERLGTTAGVEITTWSPEVGHFNAFPLPIDANMERRGAPAYHGQTPASVFAAVHALSPDTIVQVNHPRLEGHIAYFDLHALDRASGKGAESLSMDFDALEVWNGFDLARPEAVREVMADWMALLAQGHHIVATGNSDSHGIRHHLPGYPRTYVSVPGGRSDDPALITRALRAGRAFVTSGPLLDVRAASAGEHAIHGPGDSVSLRDAARRVDVRVQVRAPGWMDVRVIELWVGGRLLRTVRIAPGSISERRSKLRAGTKSDVEYAAMGVRFDRTLSFDAPRDTFVVVVARGERTMDALMGRRGVLPFAFSNPIWIDSEADGLHRAVAASPTPRATPAAAPARLARNEAP